MDKKSNSNNNMVMHDADAFILQMNTLLDMVIAANEDDMEALDEAKKIYLTRKEEGLFDPSSVPYNQNDEKKQPDDDDDEDESGETSALMTINDNEIQKTIFSPIEEYNSTNEPKHVRTMDITDHGKMVRISVPSLTPAVSPPASESTSRTSPSPSVNTSKSGSGVKMGSAAAGSTTRSSSSNRLSVEEEEGGEQEHDEEEKEEINPENSTKKKSRAFVLDARLLAQQQAAAQQQHHHHPMSQQQQHHPFFSQQQHLQRGSSTRSGALPPIDDERSLISELTTPTVDTRHVPTQEEMEGIMSSTVLEEEEEQQQEGVVDSKKTLELMEKSRLAKERAEAARSRRNKAAAAASSSGAVGPPSMVSRSISSPVQQYRKEPLPSASSGPGEEMERPSLEQHPPPPSQQDIFHTPFRNNHVMDAWLASGSSPTRGGKNNTPAAAGTTSRGAIGGEGGAAQYRIKHSQQKQQQQQQQKGIRPNTSTTTAKQTSKLSRPPSLKQHNRSVTDPGSQRFSADKISGGKESSAAAAAAGPTTRRSYHINEDILADTEGPNYFPSYMRTNSEFTRDDDDSAATPRAIGGGGGGGIGISDAPKRVGATAGVERGTAAYENTVNSSAIAKRKLDPFKKTRSKTSKIASSIGVSGKTKNKIWSVKGGYGNAVSGARGRQSTRNLLSGSNKYQPSDCWNEQITKPSNTSSIKIGALDRKLKRKSKKKDAERRGNDSRELDGAVAGMGKDIDYIFRELSVHGDQNDDDDDKSVASMLSTAKIKYMLGNVASSLRELDVEDEDEDDGDDYEDVEQQQQQQAAPQEPLMIDEDGFIIGGKDGGIDDDDAFSTFGENKVNAAKKSSTNGFFSGSSDDWWGNTSGDVSTNSKKSSSGSSKQSNTASKQRTTKGSSSNAPLSSTPEETTSNPAWEKAQESKEARLEAVEKATKKRMAMLRKLVAEREAAERAAMEEDGVGGEETQLSTKLDFVEAETMKQISMLKERLHHPPPSSGKSSTKKRDKSGRR